MDSEGKPGRERKTGKRIYRIRKGRDVKKKKEGK